MQQSNWRYCSRCQGLFYAGLQTTTGACPAGGGHDYSQTPRPLYTLDADTIVNPKLAQPNWRWCNKCQGLFFAGNFTSGTCPAGGGHDSSGSADYALAITGGALPNTDNNWRWCGKCQGLFTVAFSSGPSPCPAGGTHDASKSAVYILDFVFE
jgi:hypothetical protein